MGVRAAPKITASFSLLINSPVLLSNYKAYDAVGATLRDKVKFRT
jgi:hypothetical protein